MSQNEISIKLSASNQELLKALEQASNDIESTTVSWDNRLKAVSDSAEQITKSVDELAKTASSASKADLGVIDFSKTQAQIKRTSANLDDLIDRTNRMAAEGKFVPPGTIEKLASLSAALKNAAEKNTELKEKAQQTAKSIENTAKAAGKSSITLEGLGKATASVFKKALPLLEGAAKRLIAIGDAAKQLNISTEALQKLQAVAEQTGTPFDSVKTNITNISQALLKASNGSQEFSDAFRLLGLDVAELQSLSPEEAFLRVAEASAHVEKGSMAQSAAIKLLGDKYKETAGFAEQFRDTQQSISDIFGEEQIQNAEKFQKSIEKLKSSLIEVINKLHILDMAELAVNGWKDVKNVAKSGWRTALGWVQPGAGATTADEVAAYRREAAARRQKQADRQEQQAEIQKKQVKAAKEVQEEKEKAKETANANVQSDRTRLASADSTARQIEQAEKSLEDARRRRRELREREEREASRRTADAAIAQKRREIDSISRQIAGFRFSLPDGFNLNETSRERQSRLRQIRLDDAIGEKMSAWSSGKRVHFSKAERDRIEELQGLTSRKASKEDRIASIEADQKRIDAANAEKKTAEERAKAAKAVKDAKAHIGALSSDGTPLAGATKAIKPSSMLSGNGASVIDYTAKLDMICTHLQTITQKCYIVR